MSSTINASTASGGGIVTDADASGVLALQTAGVTALSISAAQVVSFTNPPSLVGTGITGTAASLTVGNATNATTSTTQPAGTNTTAIATTANVYASSLGWGQTWQAVTRAKSTTYYNTTGKPIYGQYNGAIANNNTYNLIINGLTVCVAFATNPIVFGLIPPGASYSLTGAATPSTSFELR